MTNDLRRDVAHLLQQPKTCLGALQLLWCPDQLKKAVAIADQPDNIKRVEISRNCVCYSVTSASCKEYLVIPNKYCSCHYYHENVLLKRTAWTCKHEIAVQLRLALTESIKPHPDPRDCLQSQFT